MVVWVLDLEDVLKLAWFVGYLGLVVYLYGSYVVQLDGEAERLQQADWGFREDVVGFFYGEEAFVGAEGCALEVEHQGFSVFDLEDYLQEVDLVGTATQFHVFQGNWAVDQLYVLDFIGLEPSDLRFDLEDVVLYNRLLICLLISRLPRIGPQFFLHLIIRRKLKDIIQRSSSVIPNSDEHFSWFCFVFGGDIAQVPIVMLEVVLQRFGLREGQGFYGQVLLLVAVQFAAEFFVDFRDLEVLPKSGYAQHIVSYVDDLHQWIVALG